MSAQNNMLLASWRSWHSETRSFCRNPFHVFVMVTFAVFFYIFYSTPLRTHVEEYFYDIRTVIKPAPSLARDVLLVTVDDRTIVRLEGPGAKDMSFASLGRVMGAFTEAKAKAYVLLALANVFPTSDPLLGESLKLAGRDPRFLWGTLNLNTKSASLLQLPAALAPIISRVGGVDTLKKRSNSLVRTLPFTSYRGLQEVEMLPTMLASRLRPDFAYDRGGEYALNHWPRESFPSLDAADFLADPAAHALKLKDKIVVFGYTVFRPWDYATTDQAFANTPLVNTPNSFRGGESITYITANAIENVMHGHWLKPCPPWLQILQTALVTFLFGWVWRYGTVAAPLIVIAAWAALIYAHGVLFSFGHLFVPLADTALFSSMALVLGAVRRSRQDLQRYAEELSRTEAQQDLASLQSRYLHNFAGTLSRYNRSIMSDLKSYRSAPSPHDGLDARHVKVLDGALASCDEFDEYLAGIRQLSQVDDGDHDRPARERIALRPVIERVVNRFDGKVQAKDVRIIIDCPPEAQAVTNGKIVDTIVYNFLSNAIKYSEANRTVRIRVAEFKRRAVIAVEDEGPGIAPEFQERIFEKFYRVKDDRVYRVRGTGLGLYLCRFFATRINAQVTCDSTPGKGSTFSLKL